MENLPTLQTPRRPRRLIRWQFVLAALLALAFLIYFFQPGVAAWWLRRHLATRVADGGATVTFTKLEADIFSGHALLEGLQLHDLDHPENKIECAEITIDFSLWRLIFQKDLSPILKIAVGKTQADWKWRSPKSRKSLLTNGKSASKNLRNRFPETFTGNSISANLECGNAKIVVANADFTFLHNAAGEIDIPHLSASLNPWKRTFNNLEGVTAIKERALYIGGLKLTPDLILERGALDFTSPDKQKITSDLLFSAFGGQWRTDVDFDRRKSPLEIDLAASFWNLSVKQLGDFVGNERIAEGTIHEGRLTFRGNPGEPTRSNTTLRFNATDFQWHERQWNSLIVSALLVNRRIEIPQFDLVQDKNKIQLKGSAAIPERWTQLPTDFQFQVLAEIDDLRSAALLILPGQKELAGEAFFAGEVRNQNGQFSGNLKMRGGPLQISGVEVDRVRGNLNLQGSEVSATALELVRRDDKAAGWGTLNLAEPRRYSGEFEVTAGNIADYGAILPKAIADYAAAGGVKLWWSGDGVSRAHSGAFKINLRDFLISKKTDAVAVDVETHGSYSPAGITLNSLALVRPNARLNAAVVVRPESLELRDLKITGSGGATVLGNMTLPINLFAALEQPTLASLLDSKAPASGQIVGSKVRLDELCELGGRHLPIRGRATFQLNATGPLAQLDAKLDLSLYDFFAPKNLAIAALTGRASLIENTLTVQGEINPGEVRDSLSGTWVAKTILSQENLGKRQFLNESQPISGSVQSKRLAVSLLHPWWSPSTVFAGDIGGALTFSGTSRAPEISGQITLLNTDWQPAWLGYPFQKLNGNLTLAAGRLTSEKITGTYRGGNFTVQGTGGLQPRDDLDLAIEGKSISLSSTADGSEAVVDGAVRLRGPSEARSLQGSLQFQSAILPRELTISTPPVALPALSQFTLPWVPKNWAIDLKITARQPIEIRGKNANWLANPNLVVKGNANSPMLEGEIEIQPAIWTNDSPNPGRMIVSLANTSLENGLIEDALPILPADLSPTPTLDAVAAPTPDPTPETVSRRLEIVPLAPAETP